MEHALELTSQAEAAHFWFKGFRRFVVPALDRVAGDRRDLRLVDCGCGTGFNLALLRPYGRAVGFELDPGGARYAHAHGGAVVRADISSVPFQSDTFDIATSFEVMQCVPDDERAMREIARIVRPGGAVVMTMAALEGLRGDHSVAWNESRRYTPALARQLVERAGLRVERVTFLFASLFPLVAGARAVQRLLRPLRGVQLDADIRVPPGPVNAVLGAVVSAEAMIVRRWNMPIGSTLLVVARKPASAL